MTKALKKRYLFSWNFDKFICVFLFVFVIFFLPVSQWKTKKNYFNIMMSTIFFNEKKNQKNPSLFAQFCGQIEFTAEIVSVDVFFWIWIHVNVRAKATIFFFVIRLKSVFRLQTQIHPFKFSWFYILHGAEWWTHRIGSRHLYSK